MLWNGKFTLTNKEAGEHRTIKINTAMSGSLAGRRIVSLMIGPDNCSDFMGVAFVDETGKVSVWKRHKGTEAEYVVKFCIAVLSGKIECPTEFEILESRLCRVCNRELTNPESIETGIGPVCIGRT